jgi:hypothetical protein
VVWIIEAASAGYCKALNETAARKRGRSTGPIQRYQQDLIDHARSDEIVTVRQRQLELAEEVEALLSKANIPKDVLEKKQKMLNWVGHDWLRAYECAAMLLRGSPAFGGVAAMKASYLRVKANSKAGALRYHLLDPHFLRTIGIEHPMYWKQVRNIGPLYDLEL